MADSLMWKWLKSEQIRSLEEETNPEKLRRLLQAYLNVRYPDKRKSEIAIEFHLYNYTFCKDQAFDDIRTSTFISIMVEVFSEDMSTHNPACNRTVSFKRFQNLLLKHSIERPPMSVEVFSEENIVSIVKYVVDR